MKKTILIIVACLVVVLLGGFYWWTGSPYYSMMGLKKAIDKHDTATALSYFDTDAMFESIWAEASAGVVKTTQTQATGVLGGRFAANLPTALDATKPMAKTLFIQGLTQGLATASTTQRQSNGGQKSLGDIFAEGNPLKVSGDTATFTNKDGITVTLKKGDDRKWRISAISGFFDNVLNKVQTR